MQDFLRKYLVPMYQGPDDPTGIVVATTDTPPPVLEVPPASDPVDPPDPGPTDVVPPTPPPRRMVPEDVFVREVTPLRAKVRETETALQEANRKIREQDELLTRLTRPSDPANPPIPSPVSPRPVAPVQPTADTDVDRRAAEMIFARDAQTVSENGIKQYGQSWVDAVNALNAYGINSPDFVSSVIEIDRTNSHNIMHQIAQDGEKAMMLAQMTPARRIAEITRISMALAAPKTETKTAVPELATETPKTAPKATAAPKAVSKAPAPPPPVEPSASKVVDWRQDDASDAEFTRGLEETLKRRQGMRR